jgi:hypothetical protein
MTMKYIKTFTFSSVLFSLFFVSLIIAVDPYEKLGINLFGFKTKAVAQGRENKFHMLERSKKNYQAFILGSSAAHRYPTQKVEELTGLHTFNYSVQHATPIDFLAISRHILSKYTPKLILLQLDFSALDKNFHIDNRLFNSPLKLYLKDQPKTKGIFENNYFTLEALIDSLRVFQVNLFGKARHVYLENGNYKYEKPVDKPIIVYQDTNSHYKFSKKRMLDLIELKKLYQETKTKTKIIVFTAPLSVEHVNKIQKDPVLSKIHIKFKKELRNLFSNNFYDFQNDFSRRYNSYLYFRNSNHPTQELSTIVLEKILQ